MQLHVSRHPPPVTPLCLPPPPPSTLFPYTTLFRSTHILHFTASKLGIIILRLMALLHKRISASFPRSIRLIRHSFTYYNYSIPFRIPACTKPGIFQSEP